MSQARTICSGVPHGINLEPLLFPLYIIDLASLLSYASVNIFNDDTSLTTESSNISELQSHLNHDLENIHNWLVANKLKINRNAKAGDRRK